MAKPEVNPKFAKDDFLFDPFGLHSPQEDTSSTASPQPPPQVNRLTKPIEREPTLTPDDVIEATRVVPGRQTPRSAPAPRPAPVPHSVPTAARTPANNVLPPRIVIKFAAHEEVSSVAQIGGEFEGISEVHIEGRLSAQVTSTDAIKHLPFCVIATTPDDDHIQFKVNEAFSSVSSRPLPQNALALIHVPKTEILAVPIGTYSLSEVVPHMPLVSEPI
jgi:hypothetical protein